MAAREGKVELAKIDVDANPRGGPHLRDPEHPGGQGVPRRPRGGRVRRRPAARRRQQLPGLAPALRGRRPRRPGRRGVAAPRGGARALPGRRRRAAGPASCSTAATPTVRSRSLKDVPGSFAADGLAARIELERREPALDLGDAFAALDAGDHEQALDLLIGALPSADGAKDDIRRVVVGILDELGVESQLARDSRRRLASALLLALDEQGELLGVRRRSPTPARPPARPAGAPAAARAKRRSRSSATGSTRSIDATGSASVRARVWVEKSSRRTLIPIVRPRRSWRTSAAQSCSVSRSRTSSSAAASAMSWSKVVSRDSETTLRSSVTGLSSSKRARLCSAAANRAPNRAASCSGDAAASLASVSSPAALQPLRGLGADAGDQPARRRGQSARGPARRSG